MNIEEEIKNLRRYLKGYPGAQLPKWYEFLKVAQYYGMKPWEMQEEYSDPQELHGTNWYECALVVMAVEGQLVQEARKRPDPWWGGKADSFDLGAKPSFTHDTQFYKESD